MKRVLFLAAVGEGATGAALLIVPSLVGHVLFRSELTGIAAIMARLSGIALIGLVVACWPDGKSLRPIQGMLTFGLLAMLYLVYVGISGGAGILLWPAVAAHAGLSVLLAWTWRKESQAKMSAA
jgi:hypothetical protein